MTLEEMRDLSATLRRISDLPMRDAELLSALRMNINGRIMSLQKAKHAL